MTPRTLIADLGGTSCRSIREIPGQGIFFASDSGIYRIRAENGNANLYVQPDNIAPGLCDTWSERVTLGALQNACSELWHAEKQYVLSVPVDGRTKNSLLLIYHWEKGAWTTTDDVPVGCLAESHDHRGYLFFGSNDETSHPGVHVMSCGWADKDGVAINFLYQTSPIDLNGRYEYFKVDMVQVFAVTYGNPDIRLDWYKNRIGSATGNSVQKRRDQQDPEFTMPVWDKAKWSTTEVWQHAVPTAIRFDVDARVREFAFRITAESRIQIVDWEISVQHGPGTNLRALNTALPTGTAPDGG